ncbi:HAD family hydrolase [Vulcanococcus limneticus]|uniref:HAD family hydrolase n=1 Tax=Vulcanococcus limneticus TaxID=2170428 RepID=UPI00398BCBAA
MARPAACLFDLDGLLLDTEPLHARAWREAAAHFGRQLNAAELMQLRGRRRLDCAEQVRGWIAGAVDPESGAAHSDPPSVEALLAVRQPIAEALLVHAQPMAGAPELVRRCAELAIPMALATSSSRAAVALKAAPHPWLELITVRVHGDDPELREGKPAPDVFLLAAARLGQEPSSCWAFEDSPAGARAAEAAGCRVHVLLPEGGDPAAYPGGVRWLDSLRELLL